MENGEWEWGREREEEDKVVTDSTSFGLKMIFLRSLEHFLIGPVEHPNCLSIQLFVSFC
jgi:hypothetical protein